MKLFIVGAGMGHEDCLTTAAIAAIRSSELVIATSERICATLSHLNNNIIYEKLVNIECAINSSSASSISVLVSGDTGFYSVAKSLAGAFPKATIIAGISSLQYLCAKLKTSWDDALVLSQHGRKLDIVPHVCYNRKVFVLAEPALVLQELVHSGLGKVLVSVGEQLSSPNERITAATADELVEQKFDSPAVMLIINNDFVDCNERIADTDFIRGNVPMTKQAIRTLSLDALQIRPDDVIVDIGAGTGGMSIELARKAHAGCVFAIDKNPEAIELLNQNKEKFKAYNMAVIHSDAMAVLSQLSQLSLRASRLSLRASRLTRAFIGGSSGDMRALVAALVYNNPNVRIVINAIALETLNQAMLALEENGMVVDVICANIAHMEKTGAYSMMKADNPVYVISGERKR